MCESFTRLYGHQFRGKSCSVSAPTLCVDGTIIGVYFGAEWCAPCRDFFPRLIEFYEKCQKRNMRFEVVFVSLDKTEDDFEKYYKTHPWLTLDTYDLDGQQELKEKLNVFGLPHLLIYDGGTGQMLTEHGVPEVTHDPDGKFYPWHEREFADLMDIGELLDSSGAQSKFSQLDDSIKAFYFAASWSEPSKQFTKKLIKAYDSVRKAGHKFEVIYVTMDKTEKEFKKSMKGMPWLALPFTDRRKGRVQFDYGVMGVPKLIIVDPENMVISTDGRGAISEDPDGKDFPWRPKPYNELTPDTVGPLNDAKCLVVFSTSAQRESMMESIREVASEQLEKGQDRQLQFYYACVDGEHSQTVKTFLKFMKIKKPDYPLIMVTFLRESAYFLMKEPTLSADHVRHFVNEFLLDHVERVTVNYDRPPAVKK